MWIWHACQPQPQYIFWAAPFHINTKITVPNWLGKYISCSSATCHLTSQTSISICLKIQKLVSYYILVKIRKYVQFWVHQLCFKNEIRPKSGKKVKKTIFNKIENSNPNKVTDMLNIIWLNIFAHFPHNVLSFFLLPL